MQNEIVLFSATVTGNIHAFNTCLAGCSPPQDLSYSCAHVIGQELASWFWTALPSKCLGMPSDRTTTERSPAHSTKWRVPSLSLGCWSYSVLPKEVTPLQFFLLSLNFKTTSILDYSFQHSRGRLCLPL